MDRNPRFTEERGIRREKSDGSTEGRLESHSPPFDLPLVWVMKYPLLPPYWARSSNSSLLKTSVPSRSFSKSSTSPSPSNFWLDLFLLLVFDWFISSIISSKPSSIPTPSGQTLPSINCLPPIFLPPSSVCSPRTSSLASILRTASMRVIIPSSSVESLEISEGEVGATKPERWWRCLRVSGEILFAALRVVGSFESGVVELEWRLELWEVEVGCLEKLSNISWTDQVGWSGIPRSSVSLGWCVRFESTVDLDGEEALVE